jgi:23S rRNA U2552 (ribose-2'-O)-methylase RlmE/FtsJ
VIHAAGPELLADCLSSGQPKIRDRKPKSRVKAKHILRLEVAVIDAQRMAVIDGVEQLEENMLDQVILAKITSLMQNLAKEIPIWTVIHDDEGAVLLFNDAMKCDDIRVGWCTFVKRDLLDMKASLADAVPCRCVKKAFDGVGRGIVGSRAKVDRAIDDSVTAITQDAYEFEGAIVDTSADSGGTWKVIRRHIAEQGL